MLKNTVNSAFNETGETWQFISLMTKFAIQICCFFVKGHLKKSFLKTIPFVKVSLQFFAQYLPCHKMTNFILFLIILQASASKNLFLGDAVSMALGSQTLQFREFHSFFEDESPSRRNVIVSDHSYPHDESPFKVIIAQTLNVQLSFLPF